MNKLVIDLKAKHVPGTRRVWRMFPGDSYRFLDTFLRDEVVFLEMPGLLLPDEIITDTTRNLAERLIITRNVLRWVSAQLVYLRSGMTKPAPEQPSRELPDYFRASLSRQQYHALGAVRALFGVAAMGDLVVVPGPIPSRQVWIGEFLSGPETRHNQAVPKFFLDEVTPARRVRWFPQVDELRMPKALSAILRIPPAISQVPRPLESAVFDNSYGTFYREDEFSARVTITGDDFNTQNAFDLSSIAQLASVICAYSDIDKLTLEAAIGAYGNRMVSSEYVPAVSLNINSPGVGSLKAATFVPIFFAAMFALFETGNAAEKPKPTQVSIVNSGGGENDPCVAQVSEAIRETLSLMGIDQWKGQCERAKRLRDNAGLRVDSQAGGPGESVK